MGISFSGGVIPVGTFKIHTNISPVWVTAAGSLGNAHTGQNYVFNFEAIDPDNGPVTKTFTVVAGALPPGLSITGSSISGIPTGVPGISTFTVRLSDGEIQVDRSFSLTVINDPPVWNTAGGSIGAFVGGTAVTVAFIATDPNGDALTFNVVEGELPAGVILSAGGALSGSAPSVAITTHYNFTIRVQDTAGNYSDRAFSMTVDPAVTYWSQIIFDIQGHAGGECAAINEIQLFDSTGQVTFTTTSTDVWDSATGNIPYYWNNTGLWDRTRLNDGYTIYDGYTATAFLYNTAANNSYWARALLNVTGTGGKALSKARVWVGGGARIPYSVRFYGVGTYNKTAQINNRQNTGLTLLGSTSFTVSDTSLRYAEIVFP